MKSSLVADLDGKWHDSELRVLQSAYQYAVWSILAIGLLLISIKLMRQ